MIEILEKHANILRLCWIQIFSFPSATSSCSLRLASPSVYSVTIIAKREQRNWRKSTEIDYDKQFIVTVCWRGFVGTLTCAISELWVWANTEFHRFRRDVASTNGYLRFRDVEREAERQREEDGHFFFIILFASNRTIARTTKWDKYQKTRAWRWWW